jgi:acetyltransferase-like isoleucine patch superfamily enzyme
MIVGYHDKVSGKYLPLTRISNTVDIVAPQYLHLADNVFIGHYNLIEASNGIIIEEGCQISNYISILTHSSHHALRLYGAHYTKFQGKHHGYIRGKVVIGKYTFIGPHSVIMPGSTIGKGSIISAYSLVKGTFPDFAIIAGNPAQVVGDTRNLDKQYLNKHPELMEYYKQWTQD